MHIETLKVFCDLAETGSFSLAASKNFITQSAVSQQIRSLEERYGRELIERSKGHARLTQAGEVLYEAGKDIVHRYREIENNLQSLARSVAGTVRVGTVYSVGLYELSAPLKRYLRTFPEVTVHLEYTRANKIYEDVSHGEIDLGIVAYPNKRPQLLVAPFREDRLVLICSPQHPFANFQRVSMKKLHGEKFVGFERDVATRRALDRVFRQHGIKVQYVMEMDNIETIKRVVEVGSGLSIVPEPAIAQEVKNDTLRAIQFSDEPLMRPLGILLKRGRRFTPAVQEFIDFLKDKSARGGIPESSRVITNGES
ncbi:MAG: LysR family transcriptional regulator [Deltaproteobacteria bacterium]|nr:LysR family transcriptional regulator [Deltaproteobacteria bacterium]